MPGMSGRALLILVMPLACAGSVAIPASSLPTPEQQRLRAWAKTWRDAEYADLIRSSVYGACGGDLVPRCRQLVSRSARHIRTTVSIRSMDCLESVYPPGLRTCRFTLGTAVRQVRCSVEFHERIGIHNPYWSDEAKPPPMAAPRRDDVRTAISFGRSSLACDAPPLSLIKAPDAERTSHTRQGA